MKSRTKVKTMEKKFKTLPVSLEGKTRVKLPNGATVFLKPGTDEKQYLEKLQANADFKDWKSNNKILDPKNF